MARKGDGTKRWKQLEAGAVHLEAGIQKRQADNLKLVLGYLSRTIEDFPRPENPGENVERNAVYHMASALQLALKNLTVFSVPSIEDLDVPTLDPSDFKELDLKDLEELDIDALIPDAGSCPMCGAPKRKS
jgi:hypothetical protein